MNKRRFALLLNGLLLFSLILSACGGAPTLPPLPSLNPANTAAPATPTSAVVAAPQAYPPALVETDPPIGASIGQTAPLTFYFNQAMNKASVEAAFSGLPQGAFTWTDDATLVFSPAQAFQPNAQVTITIANTVQSASGFGLAEPITLNYTVSDFLRAVNILPQANALDVDVSAAVVASFNQPVLPLGADSDSLPPAFTLVPAAKGQGEWLNTSTYIFYPEPALNGGTEYAVSLNPDLRSVTGVGFAGSEGNAWKFVTASPRVVSVNPPEGSPIPLDPQIEVTFNQPMDRGSVEANFLLNGTTGPTTGKFTWNDDATVVTFKPNDLLARGVGYLLNVGADAKSQGGTRLGTAFGAVLNTYPNFAVKSAEVNFGFIKLELSSPLAEGEYQQYITVDPPLELSTGLIEGTQLSVFGDFTPDTDYKVEIAGNLPDQWGQTLGAPYKLDFRSAPLPASLSLNVYASSTSFVRPEEPVLYARTVSIQDVDLTVAPLTLTEYITMQDSFENQQAFNPANPETISQTLPPARGRQEVKLNLTRQNTLPTGLYYVSPSSPQMQTKFKQVFFAAASQVNLTFKLGATEAFLWAVDLTSRAPVANAPVTIYDNKGLPLGSGVTDESGIWQGPVGDRDAFSPVFAVLGAPGEATFGLAVSNWNTGFNAYDFGYVQDVQKPHLSIYLYTDRPIYRPGQTVYYKGVVREAFDGRYQLPTVKDIPLTLTDANGNQLASLNLPLSPFGTFNGQFELPSEAAPGGYTLSNPALQFYFAFQVAEYRKPEIDLKVAFANADLKAGGSAKATVDAAYYFGAPAGNVAVNWTAYVRPAYFPIPNFETGVFDDSWLDVFRRSNATASDNFGLVLGQGTGQTTGKGQLSIELPAIPESDAEQVVTLEVTVADESGVPVSARSQVNIHPAEFYIGLRPDQWFGTAKSALGFDVLTVDWAGETSGDKTLVAEFKQVRWEKKLDANNFPEYTPVYTPVSSSNLATGPDGRARLSFIPPTAGTFMLDVSGNGARTQTLIWVGGADSAIWADLPSQRLQLTADKDAYRPGDTAKVFIPNPFAGEALGLVTVERGTVSRSEVVTISGSGREYSLPLTLAEAPNVYVNVTLLGQGNEFRSGMVNIPVAPDDLALNVQVSANPPEAGPRDQVTFDVSVTDAQGAPVTGEFSFAVVDKAVLALADPNAEDILPAFYKEQPLGITTGLSVAVYGGRNLPEIGGLGGGGGGDLAFIREDFPDTAYWNPTLITNSEGRGQVTLTLPDSLTTWNIDVRGLTADTKVGQAQAELVSTKPLLIRPVTPRFLVSGDHVLMAAIVNNNTASPVQAAVNLQSAGFVLDDPGKATYNVEIPANGRYRVEWWGTAGQAQSADLVFSVTTSSTPALQDSARPVWGSLPILQYTSPQAFVTGGVLKGAASQQEVISLPRTYDPTSGGLEVELSTSPAGNLLSALEAMRAPEASPSAETLVSYLLPHIEVYRALNGEGLSNAELSARVTAYLETSASRLAALQNADGGWSWWRNAFGENKSDPYLSAYVFLALQRARITGAGVSDEVFIRGASYLQTAQPALDANTASEALDTAAFIQFALSQVGPVDPAQAEALYAQRDRFSPVGRAFTAMVLQTLNPGDQRAKDLVSNLETSAIQSASSAHWETPSVSIFTRGSSIYTTSVVLYALAQLDPTNVVVSNAVRWLTAHRNAEGLWNIGHDNAWALLALNQAMVGIGDIRADYAFNATLNGGPLTSGDVAGIQIDPLTATVPLEFLSKAANLLTITREDGLGRLYYNAVLNVNRPVQDVKPIDKGLRIDRVYCQTDPNAKTCTPLTALSLASGQTVTAQLTLILPTDMYYLMLEDFIPAGMEILDRNLKTSQQGPDSTNIQAQFDDKTPYAEGWGWWLFNQPQIRDDSMLFSANFLPAGTYVLTYTLVPLQTGEYQALPAHAWQTFFPEVQGTSAGAVFEIKP